MGPSRVDPSRLGLPALTARPGEGDTTAETRWGMASPTPLLIAWNPSPTALEALSQKATFGAGAGCGAGAGDEGCPEGS